MQIITSSVIIIIFLCCWSTAERCELITSSWCQNLGYNSTLMPNFLGHGNQVDADSVLKSLAPLLTHNCSKYLRLFICSEYVPMCSEHVSGRIPACKGLCEKVKEDCHTVVANLEAISLLEMNCSRFPESPTLCMQQPPDDEIEQLPHHQINYFDDLLIFNNNCPPNTTPTGDGSCSQHCSSQHKLDPDELAIFEMWTGIFSIICLILTSFALITFIIQPKRFRWPARPILYLTACGFSICSIYLIRWIEGPYTCSGYLAYEKPSESLSCVGISLILLFCDIAYTLWWTVFCFVWFLSAVKEWSTEAIEKISTRLHAIVWICSAIPMFYVLMSNSITVNHLSGFCEVSNRVLVFFQLFFMFISTALAALTSVALKNVRKTLLTAGRSPVKLERLLYRLLIVSVGISIPYFLYLICQFYSSFEIALATVTLRKVSITFATFWVYSTKTVRTWTDLICCKKKLRRQNVQQIRVAAGPLLPNVFQNNYDIDAMTANVITTNAKNIVDEKKTILDLFFASTMSTNGPINKV